MPVILVLLLNNQKQCPYFGPIYEFLKNGTLPADKKRAHAIPYESNQYEIVNDTLYHFFQPRSKKKTLNGLRRLLNHDTTVKDPFAGFLEERFV
jgi:hypothetical protein